VDHEERIPEIDLDMEQSEKDQAKGAHVLAAMEKQFGPIDEELTELANRSTIDNDEYERV
ncbi:MAG TPA: hypothetical protein VFK03_01290, partial [Candidatus Saccharimonadales bacterium]|nr:hypothetical protein [Candidatus Saccharimonadales bacterium]